MEIDTTKTIGFFFVFLVILTLGIVTMRAVGKTAEELDLQTRWDSESVLADNGSAQTISRATTSRNATVKNDVWVHCDGDDDFFYIPNNESVSYWYRNLTMGDFSHIVNSSDGNAFLNGSSGSIGFTIYYDNSSDFIFCKTDATTFVNVSVDEIRIYTAAINSSIATELFEVGR